MGLKKRNNVNAQFSMSSLTDIIFLLLIFFMLTSSLIVPNALNLKLPGKSRTTVNQPKYPPAFIKINRQGTYYLNNTVVTRNEMEKQIRTLKKDRSKLSMVISPDDNVPNEYVVAVMDIAYRYGVDAILTDPK